MGDSLLSLLLAVCHVTVRGEHQTASLIPPLWPPNPRNSVSAHSYTLVTPVSCVWMGITCLLKLEIVNVVSAMVELIYVKVELVLVL